MTLRPMASRTRPGEVEMGPRGLDRTPACGGDFRGCVAGLGVDIKAIVTPPCIFL
jgi:hypothetical protein